MTKGKLVAKILLLAGEAQSNESKKAIQACNDYLRMGAGRSLAKLHQHYTDPSLGTEPPTTSLRWMKEWSRRYGWVERAKEWDAGAEERKNAEYERAMQSGLALDYNRVDTLRKLARFLEEQIYERGMKGRYHNVWVPDVKIVGHGEDAMVVDIERFNGSLIREFRATLDDIAQETGGRVKKRQHELTGADGGAIEITAVEVGGIDPEGLK